MTPPSVNNEVADGGYGAQFASFYDMLFPRGQEADLTAQKLAELHPNPKQGTLELGVGTGRIALPFSKHVGEIDVIDSSVEMLEKLRDNLEDSPLHLYHGNFIDGFPQGSYGMIYCVCQTFSMTQNRAEQLQILRNAYASLVPGGCFVLETGNPQYVKTLTGGQSPALTAVPLQHDDSWLITHSRIESILQGQEIWHCRQILIESSGEFHTGTESSLLTSPADVARLASQVGFKVEKLWGGWTEEEYDEHFSPLYVTVLNK